MCETRDVSTKWPHWHTVIFVGDIRVDVRHVCCRGQGQSFGRRGQHSTKQKIRRRACGFRRHWRCCGRRRRETGPKSIEMWPENWSWQEVRVQKKLFDIGWSVERECRACHKQEGTEKHRLHPCPEWQGIIREAYRKWKQKAKTSKKEWKWRRGVVADPLSESQWNRVFQYEEMGVREA